MKIVWKVGDKPTGRYRSFQDRSWPMATFGRDGPTAARLAPINRISYEPRLAESVHLRVLVAKYSEDGKFEWRRLKATVVGVTAGKELYARFLAANPEYDYRLSL